MNVIMHLLSEGSGAMYVVVLMSNMSCFTASWIASSWHVILISEELPSVPPSCCFILLPFQSPVRADQSTWRIQAVYQSN